MSENLYSFQVKNAKGATEDLSAYKGKVVLIVNVASKCGFTPQYEGLEELNKTYKDKGLVILGFPCNQFGSQEPGSDAEVQEFCKLTYGVSFPVMAKVDVNGDTSAPLYQWLKSSAPGLLGTEAIKWNFTKFLINKEGQVIERFAPTTKPKDLTTAIDAALK
jgi:glutathione peroxidase